MFPLLIRADFDLTLDNIKQWLLFRGPVAVGTAWYAGMDRVGEAGYVIPSGPVTSYRPYLLTGYDPDNDDIFMMNWWIEDWGWNGIARIRAADWERVYRTPLPEGSGFWTMPEGGVDAETNGDWKTITTFTLNQYEREQHDATTHPMGK